jgi:uncharacterized protein YhfF
VQQRLVSLQQLLRLLDVQLGNAAPPLLATIREEIAAANAELRELARGLHPVGLSEGGLAHGMEVLSGRTPLQLDVERLPDRRLPDPIEVTVFFLVSEALTNAAKHGGASIVRVAVDLDRRAVRATVADDGCGGADPARGSGLKGLEERVGAVGGRLEVDSPPERGTTLTATIPLSLFRTAREPFFEITDHGVLAKILDGRKTVSISVAREWELEGGVPTIGDVLPLIDLDGTRYGAVEVHRTALVRLHEIDERVAAPEEVGHSSIEAWRESLMRYWTEHREEMAELFGEPGWALSPDEPMSVLRYRLIERTDAPLPDRQAPVRGSSG